MADAAGLVLERDHGLGRRVVAVGEVHHLGRAGVIEIWLMSKSKCFGPGAYDELNGTLVQVTAVGSKPSCLATAYATADS